MLSSAHVHKGPRQLSLCSPKLMTVSSDHARRQTYEHTTFWSISNPSWSSVSLTL